MKVLIPPTFKVFTRKDISERKYLTYGDTHGTDIYGRMSPNGPIPAGKYEYEISTVIVYEEAEQITADAIGEILTRGEVFEFENKKWMVEESSIQTQREWSVSSIVAVWRKPIDLKKKSKKKKSK